MSSAVKVHLYRVARLAGMTFTGSLCNRLRTTADGMNLTSDEKAVTCAFCLRRMKRRAANEKRRS
jgi:hypothetical protein